MIESAPMIDTSQLVFQQDLAESLAEEFGIEKGRAEDLGATTCSGVCYWEALNALGFTVGPITEFIHKAYSPEAGVTHPAGVDHIRFLQYLKDNYPGFYGLSINPFREQDPGAFRAYKGYSGQRAEDLFDAIYPEIKDTSSAAKSILYNNGYALISANPGYNGYNGKVLVNGELKEGTTHLILAVEYISEEDCFIIFDPDKRAYEDLGGKRPHEITPLQDNPGLYKVPAGYINLNSFRQNPSPGGITVGLFKEH